MPKRSTDISLSLEKLQSLCDKIEYKFFFEVRTGLMFTGDKNSDIYKLLQKQIFEETGVQIGVSILRDIMTLKHSGIFRADTIIALNTYIKSLKVILQTDQLEGLQRIYWGVNQGLPAGAYIEKLDGEFIPWKQLKKELEERAISQCPKFIPPNCTVKLCSFYGKKDWTVRIFNKKNKYIGSVWIGGDPYNQWKQDGLVRVGETIDDSEWRVHQILARYKDGSYKIIRSFI